ncbi:MAG: hypothetical protein HY390_05635 [Deltaproteobacteria bacterium]|nr:hypothetical protein [Deltaproteobacteria bacterium]
MKIFFNANIEPNEPLSRFIFSSDHLSQDGTVKGAAFNPSNKGNDLSVYRIKECKDRSIWIIGKWYVEKKRKDNKKLIARSDFNIQELKNKKLRLNPNGKPHFRHLNIENWPDKPASKLIATQLAAQAKTFRKI